MSEPRGDDTLAKLPSRTVTPEQCDRVARLIRTHAHDQADSELLYDAILGPLTTEQDEDPDHNMRAYKAGCRCERCRGANTARQRMKPSARPRKVGTR